MKPIVRKALSKKIIVLGTNSTNEHLPPFIKIVTKSVPKLKTGCHKSQILETAAEDQWELANKTSGSNHPISDADRPNVVPTDGTEVEAESDFAQSSINTSDRAIKQTATNSALQADPEGLLRVSQIIGKDGLLPISRAKFYEMVKEGILPKPIKLSSRVSCWRRADIIAFIHTCSG